MESTTHPEVREFIRNLPVEQRGKTLRAVDRLEEFGPFLFPPYAKKVDIKLWELRVRGKMQVRLFYTFANNKIYILSGFIKKSGRIPNHELALARQRLASIAEK